MDLFHNPWVTHQTEVVTCETGDHQQCHQDYYLSSEVLVLRLVTLAMVPRQAGSSSPAIFRFEAVVSCWTHIQRINGNVLLHVMLWEGHEAVEMTTVQACGLDVPRRRDGRLHRIKVFV